jgi:hypothetical protein
MANPTAQEPVTDWPLDPGERVLWQGRPSAALHVGMRQAMKLAGGLFGLMLFLYLVRRLNMQVAPFWDVWVIVLTVFFASIPLDVLRGAWLRRRTRYALTDRRALIAVDYPVWGRLVRSVPLTAQTRVDYLQGRNRATLTFPLPRRWPGFGAPQAGFERIADGAAVFARIGRVQRGEA